MCSNITLPYKMEEVDFGDILTDTVRVPEWYPATFLHSIVSIATNAKKDGKGVNNTFAATCQKCHAAITEVLINHVKVCSKTEDDKKSQFLSIAADI